MLIQEIINTYICITFYLYKMLSFLCHLSTSCQCDKYIHCCCFCLSGLALSRRTGGRVLYGHERRWNKDCFFFFKIFCWSARQYFFQKTLSPNPKLINSSNFQYFAILVGINLKNPQISLFRHLCSEQTQTLALNPGFLL